MSKNDKYLESAIAVTAYGNTSSPMSSFCTVRQNDYDGPASLLKQNGDVVDYQWYLLFTAVNETHGHFGLISNGVPVTGTYIRYNDGHTDYYYVVCNNAYNTRIWLHTEGASLVVDRFEDSDGNTIHASDLKVFEN